MSSVDPCIVILGDWGVHLRLRVTDQSNYFYDWVQGPGGISVICWYHVCSCVKQI